MNKDMKELYKNLKEAKDIPNLYYTLSSAEIYILIEYLDSLVKDEVKDNG